MATAQRIADCLRRDMGGDLGAGIRYAERIARAASFNPWANPADAWNYKEAAKILRAALDAEKRGQNG